jgi:hypothetical protein
MKSPLVFTRDQITNMALATLRATRDGDMLAPHHLKLVELAVNHMLNADGLALFFALYSNATKAGGYTTPFLFGIENLTIDQHGVVRWRGTAVEQFDHAVWKQAGWRERMLADAQELAARCRSLEAKGIQPTAPLLLQSR